MTKITELVRVKGRKQTQAVWPHSSAFENHVTAPLRITEETKGIEAFGSRDSESGSAASVLTGSLVEM